MKTIDVTRGHDGLVLGASLDDAERALGPASTRDTFDDFVAVDWRPLGLRAYATLEGTVTMVMIVYRQIDDEGFVPFAGTTERDIGAGSTIADVEAAYGPAPEARGNKGDYLVYPGHAFTFRDGLLHDIQIAADIEPRPPAPLPPPPGPNASSARVLELVAELERRIASYPHLRLVFTPAEPAWLDRFEHGVGCRMPPSYRELVLRKGTIRVDTPNKSTFWMIPVADLGGPSPSSWVDEGDEEVDAAVGRAIFFAYQHDDAVEDFYAFDPSSPDAEGELSISAYRHDEMFALDGGASFVEYIEAEIDQLFRYFAEP